jgi:uncharacterized protein YcbX
MQTTSGLTIGRIEALYRYPVKSMACERLDAAELGWHGLEGDRRLALRRLVDRGGFPWLTASKLAELLLFTPHGNDGSLPTHVRTPEGVDMPIFGDALAEEIARRHGAPLQMMHMKHGIFDDGSLSVIAADTVAEVCRLAEQTPDARRFRPNVVVSLSQPGPFLEDLWLGRTLSFGDADADDAPAIAVTMRDARCSMVNLDPDSARSSPEVLKAAVRANANNAGIYGTVIRTGRLVVGQPIYLR